MLNLPCLSFAIFLFPCVVVPMGQHMLVLSPCIGKHMPLCQPQIQTDIPKGIFQPAESSTKLQTTFGHYFPQSARNPMPRNSLETPSPDSVMSKQADSKGTAKPQLLTTPSPDLSLGSPGQPANTHALQLCLQPAAAEFRQISSSRSTPGHCGSSRVHLQPTTMLVPLRPISSPCIATPISVSSGIGLDSNVRTSVHEDTSRSLPGYCSDRAHTLWQACSSGTEPPSNVERHSDGSLLQARRVMGVQSSPIYGTTLDKTFPTGAECPSDSVRFEAAYSSLAVDHQYSDSDSTCSSSTADAVGCPSESGILSDTASCYEDEISYGCGGEDALPLSLDMLKKVVEPSTAKQVFDSSATDVLHLWVCKNIQVCVDLEIQSCICLTTQIGGQLSIIGRVANLFRLISFIWKHFAPPMCIYAGIIILWDSNTNVSVCALHFSSTRMLQKWRSVSLHGSHVSPWSKLVPGE